MDDLVSKFSPITLSEMNAVKLLNRTDTKFVTSTEKLKQLLMLAHNDYRILVADGKRISPYYTVYFDTDDLDMFRRHQAGHADRQKLRIRSYVSSQLNFLEIKTKDNHKRTRKQRVTITGFDSTNPPHDITFHSGHEQRFGTCDDRKSLQPHNARQPWHDRAAHNRHRPAFSQHSHRARLRVCQHRHNRAETRWQCPLAHSRHAAPAAHQAHGLQQILHRHNSHQSACALQPLQTPAPRNRKNRTKTVN